MGLFGLARELVTFPVSLAPSVAGLAVDATKFASRRVGELLEPASTPTASHGELTGFDLTHRHRRRWSTGRRAHLELRAVEFSRQQEYLDVISTALGSLDGVESVTPLPGIGRIVVSFDPAAVALEEIERVMDVAEQGIGLAETPFDRARPDHPSDAEPMNAAGIAVVTDAVSLGIAGMGRVLRLPATPVPLDVAALLTVVSYVPWLRDALDRRVHSPATGLVLGMARAVTGGLGQQVSGPAIDLVHRASQVSSVRARQDAWRRLEPLLVDCDEPNLDGRLRREARPGRIPPGPIERTAVPTSVAAFAGAGLGLLLRPNFDQTVSFLVAGAPKATRWGREAYTMHLASLLSSRDILVMDLESLALLDRIDIMVVDGDLISRAKRPRELEPFASDFLTRARTAGTEVWIATDHPERFRRLPVAGVIEPGQAAVTAIREMQQRGHGVAVVGTGDDHALVAADVSLGLRRPGMPVPWNASMIAGESLLDAYVLALAIQTAKRNAAQAARVAIAGTGVAGLTTLGGLRPGGLGRVMGAVNISALIAHLNGMRLAGDAMRRPLPQAVEYPPFHAMAVAEVLARIDSDTMGLTVEEAGLRQAPIPRTPHALEEFLRATGQELVNPLTPILVAGAGLAAAAGTVVDAAAVAGVLGLNALLGGAQRFRADRASTALLERANHPVTVIRDGQPMDVVSRDVVVGDVVHLQAGDVVPADCRIMSASALQADESSLTGESMPAAKRAGRVALDAAVSERESMLYAGTTIASGSADAVVVAVGADTEAFRGIDLDLGTLPETGVEQRLESLTARVSPISVSAGLAIVGTGLARGLEASQVLGSGVGLAVAAVPEGLPLLATAAQQSAARRLSKHGVLVRNARAIEALGRVDVICADKTGTLTVGKIRVAEVAGSDGITSGVGDLSPDRRRVLAVARAATPEAEKNRRLAHPTDRAVIHAIEDASLDWRTEMGGWDPTATLPFEPSRGYHAAIGTSRSRHRLVVKGAPEILLARCTSIRLPDGRTRPLSASRARDVQSILEASALQGLRMLVVADKEVPSGSALTDDDVAELRFLGSIGLADPVRLTSKQAVADLTAAHIRVLMITGDHPATARGVAADLGLSGEDVLTGADIDRMDDAEVAARLAEVDVCARVTPAHKVRIVRALRQSGRVVAMTGDGANDALAIRLADVGIALGTRATEAARSAADLVVVDDSIETIVSAVVEGRSLWLSVRDAISILVGGNLGEIGFTLAGALPSGVAPLNTRQLLLVNLMTDVIPAMAIAVSPPAHKSPRELLIAGPDKSLGKQLDDAIVLRAAATATGAGCGWVAARMTGRRKRASTVALASLVSTELGQTLASSWRSPLVVASSIASFCGLVGVVQTPGISQAFGCTPLGPVGWTQAITSATAATAGSVVVPALLRVSRSGDVHDADDSSNSRSRSGD
jgi:cation-transporting P-type ATPase I